MRRIRLQTLAVLMLGTVTAALAASDDPGIARLAWIDETGVVFENLANDFPQRVAYRRHGDGMQAWIEGTRDGQVRRVEFPYQRVACTPGG